MRPMLLVIEMLADFLDRWPADERAALVAAIDALVGAFRAARRPVVWVRQESAPDLADAFREMRRDNIRDQRDLDVVIVREAVGPYDREQAAVSLRYLDGKIATVLARRRARLSRAGSCQFCAGCV